MTDWSVMDGYQTLGFIPGLSGRFPLASEAHVQSAWGHVIDFCHLSHRQQIWREYVCPLVAINDTSCPVVHWWCALDHRQLLPFLLFSLHHSGTCASLSHLSMDATGFFYVSWQTITWCSCLEAHQWFTSCGEPSVFTLVHFKWTGPFICYLLMK